MKPAVYIHTKRKSKNILSLYIVIGNILKKVMWEIDTLCSITKTEESKKKE